MSPDFLWTLFELCHLRLAKTNLKIGFEEAMKQNLLGVLAGDFSFSFRAGVGMHMRFCKRRETDDGFDGVIEEVYFSDPDGRRHNGAGGVLHLFQCIDHDSSLVETDSEALQSFIISSSQQAEFAHRALVTILSTMTKLEEPRGWRQVLDRQNLPLGPGGLRQAAQNALTAGLMENVNNQKPNVMPQFLT